jgi:hypothetical protein
MKYRIYASLHEEIDTGWVWLGTPVLPPRSIVKIRNTENKKIVFCEALQIEENFIRKYNESENRMKIDSPKSSLVISCWYRKILGDLPIQSETELKIVLKDNPWGRLWACLQHPQVVVRIGTWLGIISVSLGLIGLFLGIMSLK